MIDVKDKIKICNDVMFKSIFLRQRDALITMIYDITGINEKINKDEIITGYELEPYTIKGKVNRSDMLIGIGKDNYLNVEINYKHERNVTARNMIQLFRITNQVVESGMTDKELSLKMVGQLNLNTFRNLNNKIIQIGAYADLDTGRELDYGVIKIWNLDIEKCYKKLYNNTEKIKYATKMERWGAILYCSINDIELISQLLGDDLLTMEEKEKFIVKIKDANSSDRIIQDWMVEENNRLRLEGQLAYAKDEGIEQGIEENKIDVIRSMLKKNIDYNTISEITNKSVEEIKEIEKNRKCNILGLNMKKSRKIEIKVYELLGVKLFRKAAFRLEKIVHRKDKGKNTNYHIQKNEVNSLGEFKKYLYYNGAIHTSNLIRGIPLLALMFLLNFKTLSIIVLSALLLKDAYCVMLQRYNWIKLSEKEEIIKSKKALKVINNCNQYKELLCKLADINCEHQNTVIQREQTINNYSFAEVQENSKVKVRKKIR